MRLRAMPRIVGTIENPPVPRGATPIARSRRRSSWPRGVPQGNGRQHRGRGQDAGRRLGIAQGRDDDLLVLLNQRRESAGPADRAISPEGGTVRRNNRDG